MVKNLQNFRIILDEEYFPKTIVEYIQDDFENGGIGAVLHDMVYEQIGEHADSLQILINNVEMLDQEYAHSCSFYLSELNNILYKMIKFPHLERVKFYFVNSPSGNDYINLWISRDGDYVSFNSKHKYSKEFYKPILLQHVVEEVIRAVNEYKDVFWNIANNLLPQCKEFFMLSLFRKEERYTREYYEDKNFDWVKYYELFSPATRKDQTLVRICDSPSEFLQWLKVSRFDKDRKYIIVSNYYEGSDHFGWFPLESLWRSIKN